MDLTRITLPPEWAALGWCIAVPALAQAARRAPWKRFADGEQVHVWYGAIFAVLMLWNLQATVGEGFTFHLLGMAALTLIAGLPLALVGAASAVAVLMVVRGGVPSSAGLAWCAMALVPAGVSWLTLRFAETRLPPNFFVYVFVVAFFGAALSLMAAGFASAVVLTAGAGWSSGLVFGDYLPYLFYLSFGEATLTGMALTLMVVYRPRWVATFDDRRYIDGR
jgi:uncharacterized membrane protein